MVRAEEIARGKHIGIGDVPGVDQRAELAGGDVQAIESLAASAAVHPEGKGLLVKPVHEVLAQAHGQYRLPPRQQVAPVGLAEAGQPDAARSAPVEDKEDSMSVGGPSEVEDAGYRPAPFQAEVGQAPHLQPLPGSRLGIDHRVG
jgi:hypothetical protein